ncbi:MAG: nitrile hydratase subunit beta [Rhodospirillaceae bacterium]|nr:nitrile hydratase subunit beta [Rhodospirillaceae bacterium]
MNSIHDMGGMHGFGRVEREKNEPVFHADWERRTFGVVNLAMGAAQIYVDEIRHAIEKMPPAEYLESPYYEHWIYGLEALLVEKGLVTQAELDKRAAEIAAKEGK